MGMEPIRYETRRTSVCAAHDHSCEDEFAAFYRAPGRYPDRLGSEEHERTIEEIVTRLSREGRYEKSDNITKALSIFPVISPCP